MTRSMTQSRISLLACAAFALSACGGGDAGSTNGDGGSGSVVVGMRSDFGGFNTVTNSGQYDMELMNYALFTPIVQYDEKLNVTPWLAERWELLGDTGVTFHLRTDVKWHDGQPVTARDIEFTFNRAKDETTASLIGSAFLAEVATAKVIDDQTITFTFTRPHAQALEDFWWAPIPKHLLENVAPAELRNAPFNRAPVGSGPYKFSDWKANSQLVIVPNPDFPQALGGPGKAARVVFQIVPEASTMLTNLVTGTVHVDVPVLPDQVSQLKQNADLNFHSFPGRTVYYIGWNNAKAPFNDPVVRRAMGFAVDRKEIVDALLYGEGSIATSTIPPWHPAYPKDIAATPYDLAKAQALLEQAGWKDSDGDGIREKNGQKLAFTILSSDDALRRSVVEVLQNQLKKAGADVQIRVMEFQTMLQNHKERTFDAIFTNWVLDNFQLAAAPMSLFHSKEVARKLSANRSGVSIPRLDAAMERAAGATDPAAQQAAWREFTQIVQEEQPVTFMFWLNELAASKKTMQGVSMDPRGELRSIGSWTAGR